MDAKIDEIWIVELLYRSTRCKNFSQAKSDRLLKTLHYNGAAARFKGLRCSNEYFQVALAFDRYLRRVCDESDATTQRPSIKKLVIIGLRGQIFLK